MKKGIYCLLLCFSIFFLSGCDYVTDAIEDSQNEVTLKNFVNKVTLENNVEITENIDIPESINTEIGISVSSSNENIISILGEVTRPSELEGNQEVTITIRYTFYEFEIIEMYHFTVLALLETPTIIGAIDVEYRVGDALPDYTLGVSAVDPTDGNITNTIVIDDSLVNYNVEGTYTVTYTVVSSTGHESNETITVTVIVEDSFIAFSSTYFVVKEDGLYGIVDEEMEVLFESIYDKIIANSETIILEQDGVTLIFDIETSTSIISEYQFITGFSEGVAIVVNDEGLYGLVNLNNEIVVDFDYELIQSVTNGIAIVKYEGLYGLIDLDGDFVALPAYDSISSIYQSNDFIVKIGNFSGLISSDGEIIFNVQYDSIDYNKEIDTYIVMNNYIAYFYDTDKTLLFESSPCMMANYFSQWNSILVFEGSHIYLYDLEYNLLIGDISSIDEISPNIFFVKGWTNDNYLINSKGEILVSYVNQYYFINNREYVIATDNDYNKFVMNTQGEYILSYVNYLGFADDQYILAKMNTLDQYTVYDPSGNDTGLTFDYIRTLTENYYYVSTSNTTNYIANSNLEFVKGPFTMISEFDDNGLIIVKDSTGTYLLNENLEKVSDTFKFIWGTGSISSYYKYLDNDDNNGYLDETGSLLFEQTYTSISGYFEGFACAKNDVGYSYIDETGNAITDFIYSSCQNFSEGLGILSDGQKMGAVNKYGVVVIPFTYKGMSSFQNGTSIVTMTGTDYGIINSSGGVVFPIGNHIIGSPNDYGMYYFENSEGIGFINSDFELKLIEDADHVYIKDTFLTASKEGKYAIFNQYGETVNGYIYDFVAAYSGTIIVEKDGLYNVTDLYGNYKFKIWQPNYLSYNENSDYYSAYNPSTVETLISIHHSDGYYYGLSKAYFIGDYTYYYLIGIAKVVILDTNFQSINGETYDSINQIYNTNLYTFKIGNYYGVLDENLNVILNPTFDYISYDYDNELFVVNFRDNTLLYDLEGNALNGLGYEEIYIIK